MAVPAPVIRRRVIIRRFLYHGAVSPETAKTPEEVGAFKGFGVVYTRLEARGVLKSCGDNKYYIDTAAAMRDSRRARSMAVTILGGIVAVGFGIANLSGELPLWLIIASLAVALVLIVAGAAMSRKL